jgi:hypothetical protein
MTKGISNGNSFKSRPGTEPFWWKYADSFQDRADS